VVTDYYGSVVPLGTASNYAILAKTAITTVPTSVITGDIAVSPAAATFMTGFVFSLKATDYGQSQYSTDTSLQVTGKAYGANYLGDTPTLLTTAVSNMETAYTDAQTRPSATGARLNLGKGSLGGVLPGGPDAPLTSGIYTFGTDVIIEDNIHFKGAADDVFIIQIKKKLDMAANFQVILDVDETTGQKPSSNNIFWVVAEAVTVKAGAHMEGIILGFTSVTFITGSSLNGRILAQTACSLQQATITAPAKGVGGF
jgi:hypothetical protein